MFDFFCRLKEGEQGVDASINVPEPLSEVDPLDPKIFTQPVILEKGKESLSYFNGKMFVVLDRIEMFGCLWLDS